MALSANSQIPSGISVETYGAQCGGTLDASAAFVAAGNAALQAGPQSGQTNVIVPGCVFLLGSSGDVTLPGVSYIGDYSAYSYSSNFSTAPYTLLLNPSSTIDLSSGGSLVGLKIYPAGMGQQGSTLRAALNQIAGFTGTAITIPSGQRDITIDHVMVNGFNTGIYHASVADRIHYSYVAGDDNTLLNIQGCNDTCSAFQLEAWDFMAPPYAPLARQSQFTAISSFSNSGGLVKVTLSSTPADPIQTGDIVVIGNTTPGYQFPNGRWTATFVSNTSFILQGSAYASASVTGEIAYLTSSIRKQPAFQFANTGMIMTALTEYGHDIGILYGPNTMGMQCMGCWLDGDTDNGTYADQTPIGVVNGATPGNPPVTAQQNAFVGGKILDKAISIYNNSNTARPLMVSNSMIGTTGCFAEGGSFTGAPIQDAAGSILMSNSDLEGCSGNTLYTVAIMDGASSVHFSNVRSEGGTTYFQTAATDCPKFTKNDQVLCPWTPVLAGMTTAGIWTPTISVGTYSLIGTQIVVWGHIGGNLSGATGLVGITGLPYSQHNTNNDNAACTFSRASRITLTTGYTSLTGEVEYNQNHVGVHQLGSNQPAQSLSTSALGSSVELEFSCTYRI